CSFPSDASPSVGAAGCCDDRCLLAGTPDPGAPEIEPRFVPAMPTGLLATGLLAVFGCNDDPALAAAAGTVANPEADVDVDEVTDERRVEPPAPALPPALGAGLGSVLVEETPECPGSLCTPSGTVAGSALPD